MFSPDCLAVLRPQEDGIMAATTTRRRRKGRDSNVHFMISLAQEEANWRRWNLKKKNYLGK